VEWNPQIQEEEWLKQHKIHIDEIAASFFDEHQRALMKHAEVDVDEMISSVIISCLCVIVRHRENAFRVALELDEAHPKPMPKNKK